MGKPLPPIGQRLWARIEKGAEPDGCWIWLGAKNPSGHGRIQVEGNRQVPVHRLVYEMMVGPIPDGAHLDHLCRNPPCVNPKHLEPVTPWENLARSPNTPAVKNRMKTQCKRGHPFDDSNTYLVAHNGRTHRVCKACANLRYRRSKYGEDPA